MERYDKRKIPYTKASIIELEVQYAIDAAPNGWGEHCSDYIIRFEKALKAHLGVKYAIATSSCTWACVPSGSDPAIR
jgi:perosamine synthetase